jgi:vitamin B12 transporter
MLKTILFFVALLSTSFAISQYTEIEEVILIGKKVDSTRIYRLDEKRILAKNASDVGDLIRLFPGVLVTNYGGIGGLKTANFRSLGAGQTSVVFDYQAQSTTQSGATDLGLIPADFITEIAVIQQASTDILLPIKSKLSGNILAIQTKHQAFNYKKNGLVGMQTGSFGLIEGFAFGQKRWEKLKISISGKSRFYNGAFPFTYYNGTTQVNTTRKNNQVIDHYGMISCSYTLAKNHLFSLGITGNSYNKQLPGAVIFYNELAKQYLSGNQLDICLRHLYTGKLIQIKTQCNHQLNQLTYTDSNYLNASGFLKNEFHAQQTDGELQLKIQLNKQSNCLIGTSLRNEKLDAASLSVLPNRTVSESMLGITTNQFGVLNGQIGLLSFTDNFSDNSTAKTYILPSIDWLIKRKQVAIGVAFRQSLRLPTFSELYYQQIGNNKLLPEKGSQFSLRLLHTLKRKTMIFQTIIQPYFARVTNKINAIPSKNLFIWSIQNIGVTRAFGSEFSEQINSRLGKGILGIAVNYTFQYCIDITDPTSLTYKHIISYSPLHSGGIEINYNWTSWRVFSQFNYQGKRFALNENISSNELTAFNTIDVGGSYRFEKHNQSFNIRLTINNLTNKSNSYINYFVLPGINFNMKISYEI